MERTRKGHCYRCWDNLSDVGRSRLTCDAATFELKAFLELVGPFFFRPRGLGTRVPPSGGVEVAPTLPVATAPCTPEAGGLRSRRAPKPEGSEAGGLRERHFKQST